MLCLHLSDLHVTSDRETLTTLWEWIRPHVRGQTIDFAIISGDLTQRADDREYRILEEFLADTIQPCVREGDRSRIIIVPGNHDVVWSDDHFSALAPSRDAPLQYLTDIEEAQRGSAANLRIKHDGLARPILYTPNTRHPERMRPVQTFLDRFYQRSRKSLQHKFNLFSTNDKEAWSAHVFPEQRIAFFGFSSVQNNDKYWHGARISNDAIAAASTFIEKHGLRALTLAAVWHHGFESEPGRPDRLMLASLGRLANAGFRLGFHGHIHRDAPFAHATTLGDFAIISTGSYGAGAQDRPGSIGRQFSLASIYAKRAVVQTYVHNEVEETGRPLPPKILHFNDSGTEPQTNSASTVTRTLRLNSDGTGTMFVGLDNCNISKRLTLAKILRMFGNVHMTNFTINGAVADVTHTHTGDHWGYSYTPPTPVSKSRLEYSYVVTASLALDQGDLSRLPSRALAHPDLLDGWEAWTVGLDVAMDELRLEFVAPDSAFLDSADSQPALPLVERPHTVGASASWQRATDEEARLAVTVRGRKVSMNVRHPIVGYRYGFQFLLGKSGLNSTQADTMLLARLHDECRRKTDSPLRDRLNNALVQLNLGPTGSVITGMFWSAESRRLLTCFGIAPPDSWTRPFASGVGIAGYAFRFARPFGWFDEDDQLAAQIYADLPGQRRYRSIVAFPIVTTAGVPLGVVGVAHPSELLPVAQECNGRPTRRALSTSRQVSETILGIITSERSFVAPTGATTRGAKSRSHRAR